MLRLDLRYLNKTSKSRQDYHKTLYLIENTDLRSIIYRMKNDANRISNTYERF